MAGQGLRILSLDGGGTRGISSIYILREIFDRVVPGRGGDVRPCEYFDIIGASGPNALCALLFVRFGLTVNECLNFYREFATRMDNAEDILRAGEGEELDDSDFEGFRDENDDAKSLETIRQQVVAMTFRDMVLQNFTDWFARAKHSQGGRFEYRGPLADVGVGRCRGAFMGSESPGHGPRGGVVHERRYHVPIWHRSYSGRHVGRTYTFWAIGLGTMGSPEIVRPGVIFPDFLATGAHSVHNPVLLLLDECRTIWPGLKPGVVVSIGTGALEPVVDDIWATKYPSRPATFIAAKACAKMAEENAAKEKEIERFVVPFDESLKAAYTRFQLPDPLPFFEGAAADEIYAKAMTWMETSVASASAATVASVLSDPTFPTSLEDSICLASLSHLLQTLTSHGYPKESEILSDSISAFMLYESANLGRQSHHKLEMSLSADAIQHAIATSSRLDLATDLTSTAVASSDSRRLTLFSASGEDPGWHRACTPFSSLSDIALAAYFLVVIVRRGQPAERESSLVASLLAQLSMLVNLDPELNKQDLHRLESLVRLASIASICEAACMEALAAEPRIILNPIFIRYLHHCVQTALPDGVCHRLIEPIATALATHIHLGQWSTYRDSSIAILLKHARDIDDNIWGIVNLAEARDYLSVDGAEPLDFCRRFLDRVQPTFSSTRFEVARVSARNGYMGLLRKALYGATLGQNHEKIAQEPTLAAGDIVPATTSTGENLLHIAANSGFAEVLKMIFAFLERNKGAENANKLNGDGMTPLHICTSRRAHLDCFKLCKIGGSLVSKVDNAGRTALHYCFPSSAEFPDYHQVLLNFVEKSHLPSTLSLEPETGWGSVYANEKQLDPRTATLRPIARYLFGQGSDICTRDVTGSTPGHLAARNGWIINTDVFFNSSQQEEEQKLLSYLKIRDNNRHSVLDICRTRNDNLGVAMLVAEMRKRCIDIPPKSTSESPDEVPVYPEVKKSSDDNSLHANKQNAGAPGPSATYAVSPPTPTIIHPAPTALPDVGPYTAQQGSPPSLSPPTLHAPYPQSPGYFPAGQALGTASASYFTSPQTSIRHEATPSPPAAGLQLQQLSQTASPIPHQAPVAQQYITPTPVTPVSTHLHGLPPVQTAQSPTQPYQAPQHFSQPPPAAQHWPTQIPTIQPQPHLSPYGQYYQPPVQAPLAQQRQQHTYPVQPGPGGPMAQWHQQASPAPNMYLPAQSPGFHDQPQFHDQPLAAPMGHGRPVSYQGVPGPSSAAGSSSGHGSGKAGKFFNKLVRRDKKT